MVNNKCLFCKNSRTDEQCNLKECTLEAASLRDLDDKRIVFKVRADYLKDSICKDKIGKPTNKKDKATINKKIKNSLELSKMLEEYIKCKEIENQNGEKRNIYRGNIYN